MEDIKEAFDDEKREYEAQTNLLKQEVEELQRALDSEDKNRKKLDEVMRANNKLQQEKRMVGHLSQYMIYHMTSLLGVK